MAGGKIDILVEPDVKGFGPKLESGLSGALGVASKVGAGLGVALGGAEVFKSVVSAGMDFQTNLNTMAAVSQATGAQLDAVTQRARELGRDTSLTATSASDAAAAMTELSKGGFTVEESMTAAKGTLQLAAAAQIDAAEAAKIQTQAMQAFSLEVSRAGDVSDILSGAANASSADIQGIALGLAQAGTVAHGFGISIEDTATALSMFANAGIQGSDAGTLLKSSLLAITDQGKPAQAAMKELGLQLYENGKFVGLPSMFEQLAVAQGNMSDEAFQAATNTLFGSDAIRQAMVAAEKGGVGFEKLRKAVTRHGQAAEVAAAQTQGLPGALERLQNTAEDAAQGVYDAIDEKLVAGANLGALALQKMGDGAAHGAQVAIREIDELSQQLKPAATATVEFAKSHEELTQAVGLAAAGLALSSFTDFPGRMNKGTGALKNFGEEMKVQASLAKLNGVELGRMGSALAVLESRSPAMQAIGTAARESSAGLMASAQAHRETAAAWKMHAMTATTSSQAISFAAKSASNSVVAGSARMAGVLTGGVAGGLTALKQGAMGVVNALGGPWALAFAGATMAVGSAVSGLQAMGRTLDESKSLANLSSRAYDEMFSTLLQGGSKMDAAQKSIDSMQSSISKMASNDPGWFNRGLLAIEDVVLFTEGMESAYYKQGTAARQAADDAKAAESVLKDLGITNQDLATAAMGTESAYRAMREELLAQGRGGEFLVTQLDGLRRKMQEAQETFDRVGPAGAKAAQAIKEVGDKAGDAAGRADKLRMAFMELAGINISADQAAAELTKTLDNASQNMDKYAGATLNAKGGIDVTAKSGVELHAALNEIGQAMQRSVAAGEDANQVFKRSSDELEAMRQAAGIGSQEWQKLLEQMQMTPEKMAIVADVQTDAAQAQLAQVAAWADTFAGEPITKNLIVKDEQARKQLESFGFKVETINAAEGEVKITMADQAAAEKLDWWLHTGMPQINGNVAMMEILMDTTPLEGSAAHAKGIIDALHIEKPSPQAQLILDEFLKGKDIAIGELAALTAESAIPKADLDKALFDAGIRLSEDQLALLSAMLAKPTADVNNEPLKAGVNQSKGYLDSLKDKTVTITTIENRVSYWQSQGYSASEAATIQGPVPIGHATGGRLPAYAVGKRHPGYRLPGSGPGTEVTDGFVGIDSTGQAIARLDAKEWVINGESSEKYNRELAAINAGTFPKLPGYAEGGRAGVTPDELLRFFKGEEVRGQRASRSLEMANYVWAGSNWGDCSSTQGQGALFAAGLPATNGRFMSTADADQKLSSIGFLDGIGSGPRLAIGWFNGGAWGGHASGSIYFGDGSKTNVEMGGARGNGQIGGGAVGADHSQHTNRRHLPLASGSGTADGEYSEDYDNSTYTPGIAGTLTGGTSSRKTAPTSWSEVAGIAASEFASGQVKDILNVFGISDTPPVLAAYAQYQDAVTGDAKGTGGKFNKVDDMKIMDLETKLSNAEAELEIKKMKLNELNGQEKTSESTKASARLAITKQEQEIEKIKRQLADERDGTLYNVKKDGTLGSKVKTPVVDVPSYASQRAASPADMAAMFGEMTRAVVGDRPGVKAPAVVGAMMDQFRKDLGINVLPMATGGMLSASRATAVPPGAFRLIGDRLDKDEFFLPDDDSSLGVGAEWARRRGYQLTRISEQSQKPTPMGANSQQTAPTGDGRHTTYHLHGPDSRDLIRQLEARELAATMKHLGG
ncbi:phage tail tape measure protein [Staphylococcus chromogenes]|nr:phage tail tape measure protein [Staphylococcus chromogenes]